MPLTPEKAMAAYCSTLAWKIPWTEEPGRLQSTGSLSHWTRLSDFTFTFPFHALEKEMATHSSVLAWRIPGMAEPGGLPSMGSHRVGHDWRDLAAAAAAYPLLSFVVVQLRTFAWFFSTPWTEARQASLSFTVSWSLLKLMSIESVMPSNHLILWCPLLLLPSIFPSIRVFSNELALRIRWPTYCIFHFSTSPFSDYSRLISFRIDWFDLLAVQGTLKSLLQHHSSKASSAYLQLNILGKISARIKTRKSALRLLLLSLPSVNVLSSLVRFMGSQSQTWLSNWTELNWTITVNHITCVIS